MLQRMISYGVYGGALAGVLLLVLAPVLVAGWPHAIAATFLLLPIYMLHQLEEHNGDRFRLFFNATIGKGRDVLSPAAVFITNVPGVWGVIAFSLWMANKVAPGYALIAVYLVLVNAVVHIIHAVVFRGYNPGLWTAVVLFLPMGGIALRLVQISGAGSPEFHALGLTLAIAIHAAIIVHVRMVGFRNPSNL